MNTVKNNNDNNTQIIANSHLSAQAVPHPAPIVRSLAEQGAPIVVQDTKTGRIRRKWLTIRGRKPSVSGTSIVDNIKSSSSGEPSTLQTPLLQGTDSALPERGRDRIKLRSRKSSTRERKARNAGPTEGQYVYKSKVRDGTPNIQLSLEQSQLISLYYVALVAWTLFDGFRRTWQFHIVSS